MKKLLVLSREGDKAEYVALYDTQDEDTVTVVHFKDLDRTAATEPRAPIDNDLYKIVDYDRAHLLLPFPQDLLAEIVIKIMPWLKKRIFKRAVVTAVHTLRAEKLEREERGELTTIVEEINIPSRQG